MQRTVIRVKSLDDVPSLPVASETPTLPRRLHFVWVGSDPSEAISARIGAWAATNPECDVLLWQESAIRALAASGSADGDENVLDKATNAAAASDVARFLILRKYGGIYLDTDMEACRPIAALFEKNNGFVVRESRWLLVASAIGLPAKSVYAEAALQLMRSQVDQFGVLDNYMSGPPLITELSRAFRLISVPGPEVLEPWTFFPDNPFRFPRAARSPLPPYGIHLFDHSWAEGGELGMIRKAVRLAQPLLPKDIAVGKRRQTQVRLRRASLVAVAEAAVDS